MFISTVMLSCVLQLILLNLGQSLRPVLAHASPLSSSTSTATTASPSLYGTPEAVEESNVLVLDHINMNHGQEGGHKYVRAFYEQALGLQVDTRKMENVDKGRKTIWMNAGITQFHLPEAQTPQVFNGIITLAYPDRQSLTTIINKLQLLTSTSEADLYHSKCTYKQLSDTLIEVIDPWGSLFHCIVQEDGRDSRGKQPTLHNTISIAMGISDILCYIKESIHLEGIAAFYEHTIGAPVYREYSEREISTEGDIQGALSRIKVVMSPIQTLSFAHGHVEGSDPHPHITEGEEGRENWGVHLSLYVKDFENMYKRAEELDAIFVNHRFGRRAYTLEEAKRDCMFRILDIRDPTQRAHSRGSDNTPEAGTPEAEGEREREVGSKVLLQLEHEIRSCVTDKGTKYKSCPFDNIDGLEREREREEGS